jgi:hypothetical protein
MNGAGPWHQQGIAGFQTHALAANLGDEFTRHDIDPFILLVMHMKAGRPDRVNDHLAERTRLQRALQA